MLGVGFGFCVAVVGVVCVSGVFSVSLRWTDVVHFVLGFLTWLLKPFSIVIFIVFFVYQVVEDEPLVESLKDFVIYMLGFMVGVVL